MGIIEKIESAFDDVKDEALEFLKDIIRIPTENPPGDNYVEFSSFVSGRLERLGYRVQVIEPPEERLASLAPFGKGRRPSVIAETGAGRIRIGLNGHYDVVPAGNGWQRDPYDPVIIDGRLYGRGSTDMKSGIAAQIYAVELLKKAGSFQDSSITVEHHIVPDEETVGNVNAGSGYLGELGYMSGKRLRYLIFTEPLGPGNICFGHRGVLWGNVRVSGKKSHGAFPLLGGDAIRASCDIIENYYSVVDSKAASLRSGYNIIPESSRLPSLLIGKINGGTWANTVADEAEFSYVRRLIPEETLDEAREEIRTALNQAMGKNAGLRAENMEYYAVNSVFSDRNSFLVKTFESSIKEVTGKTPGFVVSPGTFDMRFAVPEGVQTLNYGPGSVEDSHASDESISVSDFFTGIKVLAVALSRLA